jgi:hypothetical protein
MWIYSAQKRVVCSEAFPSFWKNNCAVPFFFPLVFPAYVIFGFLQLITVFISSREASSFFFLA